jgi:hypothetical protein
MKKIIYWFLQLEEEATQINTELLSVKNGRVLILNDTYNVNCFLSNRIFEKCLFDIKEGSKTESSYNTFKQNPQETKTKYNHKFENHVRK